MSILGFSFEITSKTFILLFPYSRKKHPTETLCHHSPQPPHPVTTTAQIHMPGDSFMPNQPAPLENACQLSKKVSKNSNSSLSGAVLNSCQLVQLHCAQCCAFFSLISAVQLPALHRISYAVPVSRSYQLHFLELPRR